MTDYLTQYADEHGYTLNVRERVEGRHRYISTAELLDGLTIVMSAESDALHSERPEVIIPIAHTQALKRLLDVAVEHERAKVRAIPADTFEEFVDAMEEKPKRKRARKVVEDGE